MSSYKWPQDGSSVVALGETAVGGGVWMGPAEQGRVSSVV